MILTLMFLSPVFSYLPQAALGALVFVAAAGLVLERVLAVKAPATPVPAGMVVLRPRSDIKNHP